MGRGRGPRIGRIWRIRREVLREEFTAKDEVRDGANAEMGRPGRGSRRKIRRFSGEEENGEGGIADMGRDLHSGVLLPRDSGEDVQPAEGDRHAGDRWEPGGDALLTTHLAGGDGDEQCQWKPRDVGGGSGAGALGDDADAEYLPGDDPGFEQSGVCEVQDRAGVRGYHSRKRTRWVTLARTGEST